MKDARVCWHDLCWRRNGRRTGLWRQEFGDAQLHNLADSQLANANFEDAKLKFAQFHRGYLKGANFSGADGRFSGTEMKDHDYDQKFYQSIN